MKIWLALFSSVTLLGCGVIGELTDDDNDKKDNKNSNNNDATPEDPLKPKVGNLTYRHKDDSVNVKVNFKLKDFSGTEVNCDTLTPENPVRNVRFYLANLSFVKKDSSMEKVILNKSEDYPKAILNHTSADNHEITLVELLGCDNQHIKNSTVEGKLPVGDYNGIHFSVGLPIQDRAEELSQLPVPLKRSDMAWMWEHIPALFRLDFKLRENTLFVAALGNPSGNDLAQVSIPFQDIAPEKNTFAIDIDLSKLSSIENANTFLEELSQENGACVGNTPEGSDEPLMSVAMAEAINSEDNPNCVKAFSAFGLKQDLETSLKDPIFTLVP